MLTLYSQVKIYCEVNDLPMARRSELLQISRMVGTHFRRFWGLEQPAAVIQQAGFVLSDEPGRPLLVVGYPDEFLEEMMTRIAMYFVAKKEREAELAQQQAIESNKEIKPTINRERKRTLLKRGPEKVWTVKPENPTT